MAKKQIIIGIIVVAVLAVAGGMFWYVKQNKQEPVNPPVTDNEKEQNNTSDSSSIASTTEEIATLTTEQVDTSNWETYRNEEYGFEFKYPKDLRVIVDDYLKTDGYSSYNKKMISQIIVPYPESFPPINIEIVNDSMTNVKQYLKSLYKIDNWRQKQIAGINAEYAEDRYYQNEYNVYYLIEKDQKVFVVSSFSDTYIIPTFKFIK